MVSDKVADLDDVPEVAMNCRDKPATPISITVRVQASYKAAFGADVAVVKIAICPAMSYVERRLRASDESISLHSACRAHVAIRKTIFQLADAAPPRIKAVDALRRIAMIRVIVAMPPPIVVRPRLPLVGSDAFES